MTGSNKVAEVHAGRDKDGRSEQKREVSVRLPQLGLGPNRFHIKLILTNRNTSSPQCPSDSVSGGGAGG